MPSRRPRRRPGENRELLLEAGIVEFGLSGYHGASTAAIAARADVPQPHVYANFATKQDLFLACLDRVGELLKDATTASSVRLPATFLYQAIAAGRDPQLSPLLGTAIAAIRVHLGESAFQTLVLQGSASLMDTNWFTSTSYV